MALTCEYTSYIAKDLGQQQRAQHKIEINGPGATGTFKVPYEGAHLITEGASRSAWQTIQATTLQFDILVTSQAHITFARNLAAAKENEYTVRYTNNGRLWFEGIILTDEVIIEQGPEHKLEGVDVPHGRLTITSIDGLTTLQGSFYMDEDNDQPYNANYNATNIYRDKILTHITRCLEYIPKSLGAGAIEFRTYWQPDTGGHLEDVWVDGDVFVKPLRGGGYEYYSRWEVLKQICIAFDMRLFYSKGRYIFEQMSGRAVSYSTRRYNIDGTGTTSPRPTFGTGTVDCNNLKPIAPSLEVLQPALRSTVVIYDFQFHGNLLGGNTFNASVSDKEPECFNDLIAVPVPNDTTRLSWKGTVEYVPQETGAAGSLDDTQIRAVFYWKIKIGNQYFVRDVKNPSAGYYNNFDYEDPFWTTTAGYYVVVAPHKITIPDSEFRKFYYQFYITTNPIPLALDGEQLSVCFGHEVYDSDNNEVFETNYIVEHWMMDGDVKVIDKDDNILEKTTITTTIINDEGNSKTIERTIRFSDGPTDTSENRITDGQGEDSNPTTQWTASNIGTYPHYELLARSMMSRGTKVQRIIEGSFRGLYDSNDLLGWDGDQALWIKGTYRSGVEEWDGEWWVIDINPASTKLEEETFLETGKPPNEALSEGRGLEPIALYLEGSHQIIDVDSYNLPVPDTKAWTLNEKRARIQVEVNGVDQRLLDTGNDLVDSFTWDNTNREIELGESTRPSDWLIIRIWV